MEEPAEGTDQAQRGKGRIPWRALAAAFTLVVSLAAGLFGGWAGSALTVNASKEAEQRTRVGEVYASYLDASDSYYNATTALVEAFDAQVPAAGGSSVTTNVQLPTAAFEKARHDYQGAINDVYVYGSQAAWKANLDVTRVLPLALGNVPNRNIPRPDAEAFRAAYVGFLDVFCREAVAEPRKGCAAG